MASRRTRIKGIANIPQRIKSVVSTEIPATSNENAESHTAKIVIFKNEQIDHDHDYTSSDVSPKKEPVKILNECSETENQVEQIFLKVENQKFTNHEGSENVLNDNEVLQPLEPSSSEQNKVLEPAPNVRRKFLKPAINIKSIKIHKKDPIDPPPDNPPSSPLQTNSDNNIQVISNTKSTDKVEIVSLIKIVKFPSHASNVACNITKVISAPPPHSEITLNEAMLNSNEILRPDNASTVTFSAAEVKKSMPLMPEAHISDSEYPAPPPSPSKINRCRIKAIPRLHLRKTSCSASESEDESKKYGRIRNNSVCSVASTSCLEPPTPTPESVAPKEILPAAPKKISRTEQSRKLAEARKEFYKRFGPNMPDKQKLKMIDLIFYNPVSNPISQKMSNSSKTEEPDIKETKKDVKEKAKEDIIEKTINIDDAMPVPQIKINASGEIVLDEQSLIVENVEVAKQRQQIKNSQLVDGDFDTGYGIYKRAPRALPWSQKETLRFYKALNLIGTDFTVMTQLFPKRSRRELKIKFKKEEKVNRQLVDKAITRPCCYNFSDLKREMEIEEEEERLLKRLREQELQKSRQEREAKRKRKIKEDNNVEIPRGETQPTEFVDPDQMDGDLSSKKRLIRTEPPPSSNPDDADKPPKKSKPKATKKSLNINSVIDNDDDDDADVSDMTQSESEEEEIIPFLKPTRSGRMPKSTIKFTEPDEVYRAPRKRIPKKSEPRAKKSQQQIRPPSVASRSSRLSSTSSVESTSDRLVPGSVVITTEEGPSGVAEYKVFMVTPEKKLTPVQLESDVIAKLVRDKQGTTLFPIASTPENNVTIPASVEEEADCIVIEET